MAKTRKLIAAAAASIAALSACSETELTDTALTDKVVEWQIANFSDSTLAKNHWANAALYKGMAVWALETDDDRTTLAENSISCSSGVDRDCLLLCGADDTISHL